MKMMQLCLLAVFQITHIIELSAFISSTSAIGDVGCDCFDWQYCRQVDLTCVDCDRCELGQGAATLCSEFNNTVCEPCPEGTYSALSVPDYAYRCYPCTTCGPGRDTIMNCTTLVDTNCGPCPRSMFGWGNGTCLECSPCPADDSAIRYTECRINGAPPQYMCAPGVCPECLSGSANVKVNISKEGGWVPSSTDSDFLDDTIEPTTEDTTVAAAVSITIAVIVVVLAIFVTVFAIWLLHGMYWKRIMRRRQQRGNDESVVFLMSNSVTEEAPEEEDTSSSLVVMQRAPILNGGPGQQAVPSLKLLEIVGFIKEVENKWPSVAEALGMGHDTIAKIDNMCNSDLSECCRAMLDEWLKSSAASATWVSLIQACNRNYLHSLAVKLEIFFASDQQFRESDVAVWDYFVNQIKRVSRKWFIIPRWCLQFDNTLLQLNVTVQGHAFKLEDAINYLQDEEYPQPIVLLGEAGAGKTTMALQLVHNWCMTGSNSQFALVIYVNMATDANKVSDLPSLISLHLERAVDVEMVNGMCDTLLKQQGKGLLIVLDGYDEVQVSKSDVAILFVEGLVSLLPKASLLLVCQPGYLASEEYQGRTIEIPLLRYDQVELYIQRTIGSRGIAMIRSSPVWPMMHNPLLLTIVCHLIFHHIDITRLSTLTQLYYNLVIKLISDQVRNVLYSEEDHSSVVRSLLNSCAEASYEAMLNCRHSVTGVRDVDTIVESGLLIKDKDSVIFTHYTFLEFFTAYHIAHSSAEFDPRALKVDHNNSLILPFISGLTGKLVYRTEQADNNSLVVASVCYSEAKSPVTGQQSTVDTSSLPPGVVLVLKDCTFTPHQQLSMKIFMQECEIVKMLDMSGLDTKKMGYLMPSGKQLSLPTTEPITSSDTDHVSNGTGGIVDMFNCKHLKDINAIEVNIEKDEWIALLTVLELNISLLNLNLSYNPSIADDDIVNMMAKFLMNNDHLQTLTLLHCDLTSVHADKIIKSLLSNNCLLKLDLSDNVIEQVNTEVITQVLQRVIIQEMSITNNPIKEEVYSTLSEMVHQDPNIFKPLFY